MPDYGKSRAKKGIFPHTNVWYYLHRSELNEQDLFLAFTYSSDIYSVLKTTCMSQDKTGCKVF